MNRSVLVSTMIVLVTPMSYGQNNRGSANPNLTRDQRVANWLLNQDSDKDGRISLVESTGLMKSNFQRNDANKDGYLDKTELGDLAVRLARGPNANRNRTRNQQAVPSDEELRGSTPSATSRARPGWRTRRATRA